MVEGMGAMVEGMAGMGATVGRMVAMVTGHLEASTATLSIPLCSNRQR